ncbi:hypothetical protein WICPIJ_007870 [Wickerhamomyces pijperi]|uniref:Ribokinase n=1 Tax=Wickerhamomyces pijperi TaxID=599730 RepID=A0A9P8Q0W4_WICPI|nr:hypothetical protein WICPIJ_007870 [Wickerhamomyces pijperi]
MSSFTVLGSLNYDLVTITERIPKGGETFQSEAFETHIGGKGLNQCVSISKLTTSKQGRAIFPKGVQVKLAGSIGSDGFGTEILNYLSQFSINLDNLQVLQGVKTGVAVILIEKSTGENRIMITPGANGYSGNLDLEKIFPLSESNLNHFVVLQNEIPNVPDSISWLAANRPGHNIVYNPSPIYDYSAGCLSNVDVLVVNEGEAVALLKSLLQNDTKSYSHWFSKYKEDKIEPHWFIDVARYLNRMIRSSNLGLVVVTLGPYGAVYSHQTSTAGVLPSKKIANIVDTTGAGDTFLGGLISFLATKLETCDDLKEEDITEALEFAILASSIAIQKVGASESMPFYDEVGKSQTDGA